MAYFPSPLNNMPDNELIAAAISNYGLNTPQDVSSVVALPNLPIATTVTNPIATTITINSITRMRLQQYLTATARSIVLPSRAFIPDAFLTNLQFSCQLQQDPAMAALVANSSRQATLASRNHTLSSQENIPTAAANTEEQGNAQCKIQEDISFNTCHLPADNNNTLRKVGRPAQDHAWNAMFQRLLEYKNKHGDCLVPVRYKKDLKLGAWVRNQRIRRKSCSKERFERLTSIGFLWSVKEPQQQQAWKTMYKRLLVYKARFGDCLVPQRYREDPKLGAW
eukprot:CAMPEP_0195282632 /NCGR_PEP_ID=MMETSP0707-20130614/1423_1 /TAXON_ID=33640 /ORGANISM="Asterionellopsis glacialis, Strain CCMP134" /LENGTH=279 /DNA_ID=CAMNT_0040341631 /DNA_START=8 /DNA_END=844 /DNA_ORIENTATION=+